MFGILITSLSKKWPLVEAVKKAARRLRSDCIVHGADSNPNSVASYAVDCFWQMPLLHDITIDEILSYCRDHHIKAIIPTRNADVEFFSRHYQDFAAEDIGIMVSPIETNEKCLDKLKFQDVLMQAKFPAIPASTAIEDIISPLYVVKERFGAGCQGIGLRLSQEEAVKQSKILIDPLFQPYIQGEEWSLDLYRSRKGKVMGAVARLRDVVERGESQVTTTRSYPLLENLGEQLAHHLNLYGHAVIQVIVDHNQNFHVIECNPRFGGASTASLAVGLDSFYWFLLECLHQDIESYPFIRSTTEVRQVRHPVDRIIPWS